jgi:hypothetical protein
MIFLWDWEERFIASLIAVGLFGHADGVKFRQGPAAAARDKFNELIKPDYALHDFIFRQKHPFAIDRGVGGSNYDSYPWDRSALDGIATCLGDKFLGIQMHEWIGNLSSDVRILRDFGSDGVNEGAYARSPRLQYGMKTDYPPSSLPAAAPEFLETAIRRFRQKLSDFGGYAYLVEGHDQSYSMGFSMGARAALAEVGFQVPLASVQVACARGAARHHGKLWGMYYEPFGGNPFSFTHYAAADLWGLPKTRIPFDPGVGHGGHFGSSRALQRRLLYYALASGASYYGQE